MINKLKSFWSGLTPANKKNYTVVAIMSGLVIIFVLGYMVNRRGSSAQSLQPVGSGHQVVDLSTKLLEKTEIREKEQDIAERDAELKEKNELINNLNQQIGNIKAGTPPVEKTAPESVKTSISESIKSPLPPLPQERASAPSGATAFTESARPVSFDSGYPAAPLPPSRNSGNRNNARGDGKVEKDIEIGDIAIVSNAPAGAGPGSKDLVVKKKEQGQKIYLPPSYMEATLLSGLDAPTSLDGKSQAAPALIRIATPAILPNNVKMQLKGCYVISECTGNLASERADCRLVSLSCVARDGRAVIDQKVKGFLVDQDGKLGLNGKVVAKMGQMLARSAIAGFFGGIGEAFSTMPTTITSTGIVTTPTTKDIARAGFAGGISQATEDLQKFYLDLGRQTLPVIEVGAAKRITLVTSEGLELDIKLHCDRKNAFGEVVCKENDEAQQ